MTTKYQFSVGEVVSATFQKQYFFDQPKTISATIVDRSAAIPAYGVQEYGDPETSKVYWFAEHQLKPMNCPIFSINQELALLKKNATSNLYFHDNPDQLVKEIEAIYHKKDALLEDAWWKANILLNHYKSEATFEEKQKIRNYVELIHYGWFDKHGRNHEAEDTLVILLWNAKLPV